MDSAIASRAAPKLPVFNREAVQLAKNYMKWENPAPHVNFNLR